MELSDFVFLILVFIAGFAGGWIQRERIAMSRVETLLSQFEGDIPHGEEVPDERDDFVRIVIEKHGEVLYLYTEDNEFVGQGSTMAEIKEVLSRKLNGARLAVNEEGAKHLEALL
jgi:hypothetical protein